MLKVISFTLLSIFITTASYGQNWNPFPYDSVYFVNTTHTNDILIPVVKSQDPDVLLSEMLVDREYYIINYMRGALENTVPSANSHWFGKKLEDLSGYLKMNSLFFDESIAINLKGMLHEADTQGFVLDDKNRCR